MKKIFSIIGVALMLVAAVSCNKEKATAEQTAKDFATAINTKDLSTVHMLYPSMREMENVQLVDTIAYKKLNVEYSKQDSLYTVKFLPSEQTLLIKLKEDGKGTIVNSHGIVPLNQITSKLAQATGVPTQRINDRENAEIFREDGMFIVHLASEMLRLYGTADITACMTRWAWGNNPDTGIYCRLISTVTNDFDRPLEGKDYQVEIRAIRPYDNKTMSVHVLDGVDLQPKETHVFEVNEPALYKLARSHNLDVYSNLEFKDRSQSALFYYSLNYNGNEFNEFLESHPDVDLKDYRTINVLHLADTTYFYGIKDLD